MRSRVLPLLFVVAVLFAFSAYAQKSIDPAIERDPLLEADAKHNLDVAWQSFNVKKAYKGVLLRFEETYAAYPDFSKMEEFLYLAGMSSYYLSKTRASKRSISRSARKRSVMIPTSSAKKPPHICLKCSRKTLRASIKTTHNAFSKS